MPYFKSESRIAFDKEIGCILLVVAQACRRKSSVHGSVRDYVLCCAILLCSAKLEEYIQGILSDWALAITGCGKQVDCLPGNLRAFLLASPATVNGYRHYVAYNDEKELISSLSATLGKPHNQFAVNGASIPSIQGGQLYRDRKYPSPKNVRVLFNRLGVPNVFDQLNRSAKRDTEYVLQSFNDIRTSVAHNGIPSGLNAQDIKRHVLDVQMLVSHLDRLLFRHVCETTGHSCWR